ncbi:MAG: hypothetical protein ACP5IL_02320 [Syntrophobacteraceae bacterium]
MQTLEKCFLLPIDGTNESLRPAGFLSRLYPPSGISLILGRFSTPPPPAYTGALVQSPQMQAKRRQFLEQQKEEERRIFSHALERLTSEGFSKALIQQHSEPNQRGVAKQACLLGDLRKVDAIVAPKQVRANLEDLMRSNPSSDLARHCLQCPIWLTQGEIEPKRAALYAADEEGSLRIADHAGFMLLNTGTSVDLVSTATRLPHPISCRPSQAPRELAGHLSQTQLSRLLKACAILSDNGMAEDQIRISLIADTGDTATQLLAWCASNGIGIIGLGRSQKEASLSFPRTTVVGKIAADFKNMAVWIA